MNIVFVLTSVLLFIPTALAQTQQDNGLTVMSMALIGVLGLLIIAVTGLAIMVVKLSFTKRVPLRRQRKSEKSTTNQKSQENTPQPSVPLTTSVPETREPVMSALYAEAETPLTRNTHAADDASQHYAEAGSTDHYSETQAFAVVDEPKPQVGVKRGGKYGYSTVNKTKKKTPEPTGRSSTLPRHLPNDNVYMPLTEGEYDHLNSPRPKNKNPIGGLRLLPYQEVSLRKKKLNKDQKGPEVAYDVPPSHKSMDPQETYDVPKSQNQIAAAQETYDVPPSHDQNEGAQETYAVPGSSVPLNDYDAPRTASQGTYDVPPPSSQRAFPGQATYDRPPLIPSAVQSVYDVPKSQKDKTASPKSSHKL
ncbi:uncharacterized protein LOC134283687 [Saccostrea cucullata]|uniref:uncharacterized protein LOC134283687 n=1 Tax=Saccostrea cuccullata TaxID=36930 RepID=UPI002ED65C15